MSPTSKNSLPAANTRLRPHVSHRKSTPTITARAGAARRTRNAAALFETRSAVALLAPGIAVHVVAVLLPEAGAVAIHDFDARQPFGAFPCIEPRHDQTRRTAMLGRNRLAIVMKGHQRVLGQKVG